MPKPACDGCGASALTTKELIGRNLFIRQPRGCSALF
jgi:hypothetical protein